MPHHKRGRAKNRRAGCLMCKPHKMNGVKKRGALTRQGWHELTGPWRRELTGHLRLVEGVDSLSRMAPWEREHGEGAHEPCDDPRCDCGWASDPLVQNVEHRTEPLTATLAEMAA